MTHNPFADGNDRDPFADDPFGDSAGQHDRDAVPLHPVRHSGDGGFLGGFGGPYRPVEADADRLSDDDSMTRKPAAYADSREAELQRREQALAARERELQAREANVQALGSGTRPALNFPPVYPIMYHAIDVEVPIGDRGTVRTLFYLWLALEGMLVLNSVACLVVLVSNAEDVSNAGASFGSSFVYLFTISAGSFFLWYRPVYNAYMKDSSLFFYLFFIFNGFHILFDAYMAVGVPGAGSAGMIVMLQCLSSGKIAGVVLCAISFALWVVHFAASLFMYIRVRRHYKMRGHSFAEAKQQAYVGFAQSGAGQAAAGAYIRSNTGTFV
ncbi:hypothetical protein LPJ78_005224 [Coemansia sp. RSA 989]|nr:hypothetical protein LPJ68_004955 [Coemansia sp. RSA 1086]KAJ1747578.1 hypothetical protein LPJ79_005151 [Coemansia sp. RSA 1821]KAJ1861621.1 hypothetical protein LPJ78_005224 [Coemansia sp. RSA 989]KAJ2646160.1 hypothetical protein IWW40_005616 [Coemansia sp. RSA 1250]KAJ2667921.1 hypothetical protein IWW42_005596 [Coemansia sp. RSA 1085]